MKKPMDWSAVNRAISPTKSYAELCQRMQVSCGTAFVRRSFNWTPLQMADYTRGCLGGDLRGRYERYETYLVGIFEGLHRAGIPDLLALLERVDTGEKLEACAEATGIPADGIAAALKYLVYWFLPMEKYMSGLVRPDPVVAEALQALRTIGIRTNLQLLERGHSRQGRQDLGRESGLAMTVILDLVHRADLSRMPWASKATIGNLIGSGYGSLSRLAGADPGKLCADFYRYGESIGKNLKLGNEIENCQRIARLLPVVIEEG